MAFLADLGLLALGSRMKALSERMYTLADEVYREHGAALQGRWFPVLRLLHDRGALTVGEIAREIGQTHSAVSQLADKLAAEGLVRLVADRNDKRRRVLALTAKSEGAIRRVKPVWRAIQEELALRSQVAGVDLPAALTRFESVLDETLPRAIAARSAANDRDAVRIVPFARALRAHFYRLNADWLQKYFHLEAIDHRVLSEPEREIIEPGGAIFFAQVGDEIVGTCALMLESRGVYELTKMAVDERYQGLGIGRKLIEAVIAEFQRRRGTKLFLESNRKLAPALRLYETAGFEHQKALKPDSHYSRSDVYMVWKAKAKAKTRAKPRAKAAA